MNDSIFPTFIRNALNWAHDRQGNSEYCFRCLAFVEDAYEQSNSIELWGGSTATESAVEYGTIYETPVPEGAFVFFSATGPIDGETRNWGHVGLSLGDGRVIHAWDHVRIDFIDEVERLQGAPGWTQAKYLGWTPLARVLQGWQPRQWKT